MFLDFWFAHMAEGQKDEPKLQSLKYYFELVLLFTLQMNCVNARY